jgi:RHH-type proline utilization regulon transcriptional repressor/proline dehydrogenase/delta 1-pyrroline-5-carboxylate dehydrogenase
MAGLMAGNAVILKPALETVLVADLLAQACWDAGVPRQALQLVPCEDEVGSLLVRDARVDRVVLTGATATARLFRELRPGVDLAAETGGKNSIIVSALADRDLAIQDALYSAFGHAGQKCSACSLLICEAEVYDDVRFMETLRDAAESLPLGPAWDTRAFVTPLIHPARDPLLRALTTLEAGESWLLEPRRDPHNPRLWSPGIKLGVREGSFSHVTELFGPHLSVMRADDLEHALVLASATPYGLTAGLHSLDEREQARWARKMPAGNLYINRAITGAVVRRQPFGGYRDSAFGAGAKAGGPNYVLQMARTTQHAPPEVTCPPAPRVAELITLVRPQLAEPERERLSRAACDYARAFAEHFGVEHDPSQVLGEHNLFRYRPCEPMLLRAAADASITDVLLACAAALTAGTLVELSLAPELASALPHHASLPGVVTVLEPGDACAARSGELVRIRAVGQPEAQVAAAIEQAGGYYCADPVVQLGRLELLHYLREQSVSYRYHRHGNLAPARVARL